MPDRRSPVRSTIESVRTRGTVTGICISDYSSILDLYEDSIIDVVPHEKPSASFTTRTFKTYTMTRQRRTSSPARWHNFHMVNRDCEGVQALPKTVPKNLDYSACRIVISDQLPRGSQPCARTQGSLLSLLEPVGTRVYHQYRTTRCGHLARASALDTTLVAAHRATHDPAHTVERNQSRCHHLALHRSPDPSNVKS